MYTEYFEQKIVFMLEKGKILGEKNISILHYCRIFLIHTFGFWMVGSTPPVSGNSDPHTRFLEGRIHTPGF